MSAGVVIGAVIYTRADALSPVNGRVGWLRRHATDLGWSVVGEILDDDGSRWRELGDYARGGRAGVVVLWSADHLDPTSFQGIHEKLGELRRWQLGVWTREDPLVRTVGEAPVPYLVDLLDWSSQLDIKIRGEKYRRAAIEARARGVQTGRPKSCDLCNHPRRRHKNETGPCDCGRCPGYWVRE